jgi:hypothetical protein
MSDAPDVIAEIGAGVTSTLALICNRLIGDNILDRETVIAELAKLVETMRRNEVPVLTQMIPSGLALALHKPIEGASHIEVVDVMDR